MDLKNVIKIIKNINILTLFEELSVCVKSCVKLHNTYKDHFQTRQ